MRVIVLTNRPEDEAAVSAADVVIQASAVEAALEALGHQAIRREMTTDLETLLAAIRADRPDVVFNLVESLAGTDRLMPVVAWTLEAAGVPFTGSGSDAMRATGDKPYAKACLRGAGLPTPDWVLADGSEDVIVPWDRPRGVPDPESSTWIIKPIWEHASLGLDETSVVTVERRDALPSRIRTREQATGRPHFAEAFVEGREFNVSLLADPTAPRGVRVLPLAEIDFSDFDPSRPRIVGYAAKWDETSADFHGTPRRFDDQVNGSRLGRELAEIARTCWVRFGLAGYARVDFRVDRHDRIQILEINVNPCLSPDAGFAAAVAHGGGSYVKAIDQILAASNWTSRREANRGPLE